MGLNVMRGDGLWNGREDLGVRKNIANAMGKIERSAWYGFDAEFGMHTCVMWLLQSEWLSAMPT